MDEKNKKGVGENGEGFCDDESVNYEAVSVNADGSVSVSSQSAEKELKKGYEKAEKIIKEGKLDGVLERLEQKLKAVPKIGDKLSYIPVFAELIRDYVKKEYVKIPIGSLTAIVSAVIYFVSPIDLIPDIVPIAGYVDDAGVVLACLCLVKTDLDEYLAWRDGKGKENKEEE